MNKRMDDLIVEINQALRDNASKAELREILRDVRNVLFHICYGINP